MLPAVSRVSVDETCPKLPELVLFNDAVWFLRDSPAHEQCLCTEGCDPSWQDAVWNSLGSSCDYLKTQELNRNLL